MCTPSDPRNQKAPGSGATGGFDGGDDGNRTHDPLLAKQVLCQLSYVPRGVTHDIAAQARSTA
jgi:hypothetical protein